VVELSDPRARSDPSPASETDFETLYRKYSRDVYRFALFLCGRPQDADDITAETFVRAWTSPEPIRVGTVKAYLFVIARNLYRAQVRLQARHEAPGDVLDRAARGPEASIVARIDLQRLLAQLQKLPEIDRTVLLMRAQDGLSYEEIAAAVGISVGAAKVKVHRIRMRLAEMRSREEP
jgi:RNA polymerase sigma-70 factor, ECF subfamily